MQHYFCGIPSHSGVISKYGLWKMHVKGMSKWQRYLQQVIMNVSYMGLVLRCPQWLSSWYQRAVPCEYYLTLTWIDYRFLLYGMCLLPFPPWHLLSAKPPECSGTSNFIAYHYSQFGFYSSVWGYCSCGVIRNVFIFCYQFLVQLVRHLSFPNNRNMF